MNALTVAISPCPNDTFIFGSWILGHVPGPHNQDARFFWHDVQELNQGALSGAWDIVKVSAATALRLTEYSILSCGGAFGLEHGPKLVTRSDFHGQPRTIAVPGLDTTAMCVLRAALGFSFEPVPMIFHSIVQAVLSGTVDAGLLIHETALVYDRYGLALHTDLGHWWREATNNLPLPLGCIVLRKSLQHVQSAVEATLCASIKHARAHPQDTWPFIAALARELDTTTLCRHIDAYVNDYSLDMGPHGQAALSTLQTFGTHA